MTNGADGLQLLTNSSVTWKYTVRNTGNVPLAHVAVVDDRLGSIAGPKSGDTDQDGVLGVGETWVFELSGRAQSGSFNHTGTVTAQYEPSGGAPVNVTASDPTSHFGTDRPEPRMPAGTPSSVDVSVSIFLPDNVY